MDSSYFNKITVFLEYSSKQTSTSEDIHSNNTQDLTVGSPGTNHAFYSNSEANLT